MITEDLSVPPEHANDAFVLNASSACGVLRQVDGKKESISFHAVIDGVEAPLLRHSVC